MGCSAGGDPSANHACIRSTLCAAFVPADERLFGQTRVEGKSVREVIRSLKRFAARTFSARSPTLKQQGGVHGHKAFILRRNGRPLCTQQP